MSHAALVSEVLFWFVAVLALLVIFIGAVAWTAAAQPTGAGYRPANTDALELGLAVVARPKVSGAPPWGPAPRPPVLGDQHVPARRAMSGQVPGNAGAHQALWQRLVSLPDAERTLYPADTTGRHRDRLRSAQAARGRPALGGRPVHRQAGRHGTHRAGSSGRARKSSAHAGEHRARIR